MAKNDFQYGGWNSYTLQCGMWLRNHDSEFTKWQHPAMWYVALGWHAIEFAQFACQWGKKSWLCACGCVRMRVERARSGEFQGVHVTARIGTPCHSIVAPSLLTVYGFTKMARQFRHDKSWHRGKFFWTFRSSCYDKARTVSPDPHPHATKRTLSRVLPHWHAKLRAVA